ncbi:MAG TPA: LamG-like jellyroll fold domain-containing protein [Yaniella sp.]
MTHLSRWLTAGTLSATLAASSVLVAPQAHAVQEGPDQSSNLVADPSFDEPGARFTLGILPDTQFYSRYAPVEAGNQFERFYGSEPFETQTQWLADNDDTYETVMSMHLGDLVDRADRPEEWAIASDAMSILEQADQPYSVLAGNHDVYFPNDEQQPVDYAPYLEHFTAQRAGQQTTLLERDPTGAHEAHIFEVDGQDFLVLALSWGADDEAVAWAQNILDSHADTPTILTSHQLISIDENSGEGVPTDFGEYIWNNLITANDQIFLTFNGHHHGATHWTRTNDAGNPVHQVLMDHQMAYMGGNGYMGLLELDLTHGKIHQTTFSPWVMVKDTDDLQPGEEALLDGEGETFTLDFDFQQRFPDLVIGDETDSSYTQQLRESITENYDVPGQPEFQTPLGSNDYPQVENTVAHWRMASNLEDGTPLPVGSTIEDVAVEENTMARIEGSGPSLEDDVVYTTSHSPQSSDAGGICFNNTSRNAPYPDGTTGQKTNLFATADDAPINDELFENGFTFETFITIDEAWTPENNRWMRWLTRGGFREDLENYEGGGLSEPIFQWAYSNLGEIQFSFTDNQDHLSTSSAWSSEIAQRDEWIHLAAINDPETKTVTQYVNGVPMLRSSVDQLGISSIGAPWYIGGDLYQDGLPGHGFLVLQSRL